MAEEDRTPHLPCISLSSQKLLLYKCLGSSKLIIEGFFQINYPSFGIACVEHDVRVTSVTCFFSVVDVKENFSVAFGTRGEFELIFYFAQGFLCVLL